MKDKSTEIRTETKIGNTISYNDGDKDDCKDGRKEGASDSLRHCWCVLAMANGHARIGQRRVKEERDSRRLPTYTVQNNRK